MNFGPYFGFCETNLGEPGSVHPPMKLPPILPLVEPILGAQAPPPEFVTNRQAQRLKYPPVFCVDELKVLNTSKLTANRPLLAHAGAGADFSEIEPNRFLRNEPNLQ